MSMPHIHTESGQHDHTVTAYIVRLDREQPLALLHMHKKLKKLLPVGGHIELDETPWEAVLHEIKEESGYDISSLELLQPSERMRFLSDAVIHPYPLVLNTHNITEDHFHSDIAYGFTATAEPSKSVSAGESLDLRWYTQSELSVLGEDIIFGNTKEIYDFVFNIALEKWPKTKTNNL